MAFDGIVVANLVHELKEQLLNGRISKDRTAGGRRASADDQIP